jgi:peptidoglycan/xylan/chitin deacetylase (PgdA/CDA1 family)
VTPEAFSRHCEWLSRHRRVLPLTEAVDRLDRGCKLPRGLAALTFDDGFAGLYEHALPIITAHRLPVTVFLVAQTLTEAGQTVDWIDDPPEFELRTLGRDQVLEMQAAGVDFQSHSYSHADLTTLSFDRCVRDLRDSRELLESLLGAPVRLLAYPRGRHDDGVRAAAARAGYTHAFTLPEKSEPLGPYAVPRVGIYRGNSVRNLQLKSAPKYLNVRLSRGYRLGQRMRGEVASRLKSTGAT